MSKRKIFSKKFVMLFSAVALGTYGIILACSDSPFEYEVDSSFTPEIFVDKTYSPLFYTSETNFYDIGSDYLTDYRSRFNDEIINDWSSFLKGAVPKQALTQLLIGEESAAYINRLYTAIQAKMPISDPGFPANNPNVVSLVEFFHFAKIVEEASLAGTEGWDYSDTKPPVVDAKVVAQISKLYTDAKDPFLKNRYWFQTMKASFYSANRSSAIDFFEKTKNTIPQNTLYYRALAYAAGAHYKNKNYAMSNYMYSIVFDKCPALLTMATFSFHPQEEVEFNNTLALAKSNPEKATLWALQGYYTDEKTAIREIYKLDPTNAKLDLLLTRLVNKEEITLVNDAANTDKQKADRSKADPEGLEVVTSIAKEGKIKNAFLWNCAAGYLSTFSEKYVDANQFFDKAAKADPHTSQVTGYELRLLRLLNTLSATTKMDAKAEAKLLPGLQWLYHDMKNIPGNFRHEHAVTWSVKYIASLYKADNNPVMAELFNLERTWPGNTDMFYQTPGNLEKMKTFLSNPSKSPWENLAASLYSITLSDINEFQALQNAYAGKLDEAIAFMELSDGKNVELLGNPFNGKIKDCHDCDHAAPQKVKYSKLLLLQKMKEMRDHVDKGEDVYNNALLLANAYYNMTYFGNARVFYYNNIVGAEGNDISSTIQPPLLSCSIASSYYQTAFDAATSAEQKAKCVYMMAKCERNAFYTDRYFNKGKYYGDSDVDFLAWEGFKKLKAEYSQTKYYNEVINECGYFQQYVSH